MTATIAILSIVIITQFLYMYHKDRTDFDKKNIECLMVGNYSGKCTYGGYHSESKWKDIMHRDQLSSQFKKILELEREIESLKKELSSRPIIIDDVRVLRDEIDRLQKEIDFLQDTGNRKQGESIGIPYCKEKLFDYDLVSVPCNHRIVPCYSNIVREGETKEIKSFTLNSVSLCAEGDMLTEEAKESIKKQFSEMFPLDIDFKITSSPPEDRIVNQAKKPAPPPSQIINEVKGAKAKPREEASPNKTNSTIKGR